VVWLFLFASIYVWAPDPYGLYMQSMARVSRVPRLKEPHAFDYPPFVWFWRHGSRLSRSASWQLERDGVENMA
jgi:hypothetical protein